MFLMVEKGIRSGICDSINKYAEVNNDKYMKVYDKNKINFKAGKYKRCQ